MVDWELALKCKLVGSANSMHKRECFKCKYLTGSALQYTEAGLWGDEQLFIISVV